MQTFPDYVGMAVWYCEEVASGRVPACDEEGQGCQRFLDMRAHALTGRADFVWSDAHVIDVCDFVSKLPHVKAFAGLIVLEPVQCWYLAGIFGFREKATGLRWVRTVRVWIPRKNAKTTLSAGVVLYCANFEGEEGADVVISAASEDQARIPYDVIRKMLGKDEDLREMTGAVDIKDGCEFTASGGTICRPRTPTPSSSCCAARTPSSRPTRAGCRSSAASSTSRAGRPRPPPGTSARA